MPIETFENHVPRVHPSAFVHASAQLLGEVTLGEECSVWPGVVMRGDSGPLVIGPRANVQDLSVLHATTGLSRTTLGEGCTVGHRVILHGCQVGAYCLVGMGSIVMDGVEIGDHSFVAAGSLIPPGKVFPPRSFILGSPGRRLREVTPSELTTIELSWQSYRDLAKRHRASHP